MAWTSQHKKTLAIGGASVLLIGVVYFSAKARKRDQRHSRFLQALYGLLKQSGGNIAAQGVFDPKYVDRVLQTVKGTIITLKKETAQQYAEQLYSAWGIIWDDEDLVYSVLRKLKDKVQLAQLAGAYSQRYEHSLIDTLHSRLNKKEINKVMAIIQPLPAYRTP